MKGTSGNGSAGGVRIPLLDLLTPHRELQNELHEVLTKALATASFVGGAVVEEFEHAFAAFCDARHCIGVNSGTDAIRFALIAAGVKSGDAVITVPNTFIATVEAISQAGAYPVFVDVDPKTYNMDHWKLEDLLENACEMDESTGRLVTKKGKHRVAAVIPVHLYGQPADMDPILQLAQRFRVKVIEDACQAHGAKYFSRRESRWRTAGSMGHAAAFSFYPGKNLGACGEAGAVTTNDPELAATIRMLRDHGQTRKYYHAIEGYNGRLDAIQAGFLSSKLRHLENWNLLRHSAAQRYNEMFAASDARIVTPFEPRWSQSVYHLYVVQVDDRRAAQQHLETANIGTGIHYPVPLHLQEAYAHLGHERGDFPVTERAAERILSLPMFPTLTERQQRRVVDVLVQTTSGVVTDAAA
jgi:dTDP-4-amino-4,6-dideoxygalactose transaminase